MTRFKNLILAFFISPELVAILAVLALMKFCPAQYASLGKTIRSDDEVWKYLPALTLAFSTTAINYSSKLRAPLENFSNKRLYEWPLYNLFVDRVYVGIFYGVLSGTASLALWFIGKSLDDATVGAIFLASTISSGTTALTMMLAHQKLRELIEKYS